MYGNHALPCYEIPGSVCFQPCHHMVQKTLVTTIIRHIGIYRVVQPPHLVTTPVGLVTALKRLGWPTSFCAHGVVTLPILLT